MKVNVESTKINEISDDYKRSTKVSENQRDQR